jgi:hypothetical protein
MTVNPQNKPSKKSPYKGLWKSMNFHTPEERKRIPKGSKKYINRICRSSKTVMAYLLDTNIIIFILNNDSSRLSKPQKDILSQNPFFRQVWQAFMKWQLKLEKVTRQSDIL